MTIPIVLEQHVEEAALLWLRRDRAVGEPHYSLDDLAQLDDQLDAHLDGLRIGGQAAWDRCLDELRWEEPGEVFPAALLAFESNDPQRIQEVLRVGAQNYELSRPLISALAWLPYKNASGHIQDLLAAADPTRCRLGLAAAVAHRQDPGPALVRALQDDDAMLRGRALRAIGELGIEEHLPAARANLQSPDPRCAMWAAWSGAMLTADASSLALLRDMAQSSDIDESQAVAALQIVLRRSPLDDALGLINELVSETQMVRRAVIGAGMVGTPDSIPWLIDRMADPQLARVAGEAFTAITGVTLDQPPLEGSRPELFNAGPTEDPQDDNVAIDIDENLPWPAPDSVGQWWQGNHAHLDSGTRYLLGRPLTADWLQEVLLIGNQRDRHAAALELAMQTRHTVLFEVRSLGRRQRRMLSP